MASSYTSLLKFNKPALGDAGWGTSVNGGFTDMVEQALTGALSVAVTSGGTTTVPTIADGVSSDARNQFITITGSLTSVQTATVQLPAGTSTNFKLYFVKNSAGGTVTVTTATGTNVAVPNGASMILRVTNAGVEVTMTHMVSLTLGTALGATSGGTGQTGYAVGDLLYADTATSLAKLADVATGNALISGGVGVAPSWGKVGLTTHVSGTLPVANGGTGAATLAANNVLLGNGTSAVQTVAPGTANNVLISTGTTFVSSTLPQAAPADYYGPSSPAVFGAVNIATTAELQAGTNQLNAVTPAVFRAGALVRATAQNTTSGTAINFTGIPSWVKRIVVMFFGVSTNGSTRMIVQLGTSGGIETTNYFSSASYSNSAGTFTFETTGLVLEPTGSASPAIARYGSMIIENVNGNSWVSRSCISADTGSVVPAGAGGKTLAGTLDRLRITTVGAADTFDAGSVNIMYE